MKEIRKELFASLSCTDANDTKRKLEEMADNTEQKLRNMKDELAKGEKQATAHATKAGKQSTLLRKRNRERVRNMQKKLNTQAQAGRRSDLQTTIEQSEQRTLTAIQDSREFDHRTNMEVGVSSFA